jgi:hypothetical protein
MPLLKTCHYPHSFTDESPSLEVSKTIFDRLTVLSSELVHDDELSPIQLWNYISSHPFAHKLNISQLRLLTDSLLHHVKCYGCVHSRSWSSILFISNVFSRFGAVVEKDICVNLVAQILAAS